MSCSHLKYFKSKPKIFNWHQPCEQRTNGPSERNFKVYPKRLPNALFKWQVGGGTNNSMEYTQSNATTFVVRMAKSWKQIKQTLWQRTVFFEDCSFGWLVDMWYGVHHHHPRFVHEGHHIEIAGHNSQTHTTEIALSRIENARSGRWWKRTEKQFR